MDIAELMTHFRNNTLPHCMIWFGEEQKIIDLYIEQIEKIGYKKTICDSVIDVINNTKGMFLDTTNKIYIVSNDEDFKKQESKWENIIKDFSNLDSIVLLRYTNLEKNKKFYKRNKEYCVEFNHLSEDILIKYIQKECLLDTKYCKKLISICNYDYGRILLELDKIIHYVEDKDININDGFVELYKQGAMYEEISDITFELTDAVLGGYSNKAIKKLEDAKRVGEPPLRIISILYSGFRNLLLYKGIGKNKKGVKEKTELLGWQIKQCIDLDGAYSIKEIERNILLCQKVEYGLKIGEIEENIALDYVVLGCLRNE